MCPMDTRKPTLNQLLCFLSMGLWNTPDTRYVIYAATDSTPVITTPHFLRFPSINIRRVKMNVWSRSIVHPGGEFFQAHCDAIMPFCKRDRNGTCFKLLPVTFNEDQGSLLPTACVVVFRTLIPRPVYVSRACPPGPRSQHLSPPSPTIS